MHVFIHIIHRFLWENSVDCRGVDWNGCFVHYVKKGKKERKCENCIEIQ